MPRIYLLDGTALAYRAHFAMARSGLRAADGTPTGAVYGFTRTLRQILEEDDADLVAVAIDAKGPTFRHKRYPDYKATREKAPEELITQFDWIKEVVRAHGLPLFEVPGFEADDVLGTLATQAEAAGWEVRIVTGDKDFMQLVSEKVILHNVFKTGIPLVLQGIKEVDEKFGTTPDHVIDVLAIMGDASDNVPGVKGIGEKGATKLIKEFGSVAGLLERLDEVKGKQREKLENDREMLLLSLELVTIDREVPIDPGFDKIGPPEPDFERLQELFRRLDFQSLVDAVAREAVGEDVPEQKRDYRIVKDEAELDAMVTELREAGRFSVDTETTSLFPLETTIVGASFSAEEGVAYYVPFNAEPPVLTGGSAAILERITPLLMDPSLERVGQNTKYDWLVFAHAGLELPPPDFDTMVASFCVAGSERRHNLDALSLHYLGMRKIPTSELLGKGKKQITMAEVPVEKVGEYACEDADATWRLGVILSQELKDEEAESLFCDLEMPLVPVLAAMERRGIRLDVEKIERFGEELETDLVSLRDGIQEIAGENFNINSTKVLGQVLFEKLRIQDEAGVKRVKKTKTGYSTDAETLSTQYGDIPIVQKVMEYREVTKLKSTYVDSLPRHVNADTGRIHCSFSQVSAATGRLASSDPNLQNIPVRTPRGRRIRESFVPREADAAGEWVLLAADYSQIELRVMAHLAKDKQMREAFEQGQDIHAATAMHIFGLSDPEKVTRDMRSQAKVINFGLLYGMGASRLARETGQSVPEAKAFIERYFASFPRVKAWTEKTLEDARQLGYVETLLGRRRRVPDINSVNSRVRSFAENAAVNTPVQGSAADIIKRAMIHLEAELSASSLKSQMLLQVHDELVLEVPVSELEETTALVKRCMEEAVVLDVPLLVEVGSGANWLEAH